MTDASFVLRVDAGAQVGFGHAGRCLALWEQLRERCVVAVTDAVAAAFVRRWGARVAGADARGEVTVIDRAHAASVAEVEELRAAGGAVCVVGTIALVAMLPRFWRFETSERVSA